MLGSFNVIAFAATTDAERARAFYERMLGLRFVEDTPFALIFDAHGTMLRITKVPAFTPQPFAILGWSVPDIGAVVAKLRAAGVTFERYGFLQQDADAVWTAPGGAKIAWFKD